MQKKYYYLACAQIAWRATAEAEAVQVMPANAIIALEQPYIRKFSLSQINGQLINNLSQIIGEPVVPELVAGVTMMSICSLGYMSEEEYHAIPSGMQVQKEIREVIEDGQAQDAAAQAERA